MSPGSDSSAGPYVLFYCQLQFSVFRENGPQWHLEIIYTQYSLGKVPGTLCKELGFQSIMHSAKAGTGIHSRIWDHSSLTPHRIPIKPPGWNRFVFRWLYMCTNFRGVVNWMEVIVGNLRVIESWPFPDYIKWGGHTWPPHGLDFQDEKVALQGCKVARKEACPHFRCLYPGKWSHFN